LLSGGNGGRGGNGGNGGNAGQSGNIEIFVKEEDIDLLVALKQTEVGEAKGGKCGSHGVGGLGGKGGKGGKSAKKIVTIRNNDGTYSNSEQIIPGGSPGPDGSLGNDGKQ
jgi:hypothetical protein